MVRQPHVGFLLVCFLAACAEAAPVRGPDGEPGWYAISCRRDQGYCREKAGEMCPRGYITAESNGRNGFVMTSNKYGTYASTTYHGEMLVKCHAGGQRDVVEGARAAELARQEAVEEDAALTIIQKHPKFPELGATKPEAKATCVHERGQWLDQGEKVGCKIKGEILFACTVADDASMSACTRYKLGADLTDERDTIAETNGKPTSVGTGDRGFRTYTWDKADKSIVLTGYSAGVIVTESKADGTAP